MPFVGHYGRIQSQNIGGEAHENGRWESQNPAPKSPAINSGVVILRGQAATRDAVKRTTGAFVDILLVAQAQQAKTGCCRFQAEDALKPLPHADGTRLH